MTLIGNEYVVGGATRVAVGEIHIKLSRKDVSWWEQKIVTQVREKDIEKKRRTDILEKKKRKRKGI